MKYSCASNEALKETKTNKKVKRKQEEKYIIKGNV